MSKRVQCASHSVCCIRSEHAMQVKDIQTTQQVFFTSTQSHCSKDDNSQKHVNSQRAKKKRALTSRLQDRQGNQSSIRFAPSKQAEHTHICVSLVAQHTRNQHTMSTSARHRRVTEMALLSNALAVVTRFHDVCSFSRSSVLTQFRRTFEGQHTRTCLPRSSPANTNIVDGCVK
jgi:hypothetical protein